MKTIRNTFSFFITLTLVFSIAVGAFSQSVDNSITRHYNWRNIGPANMGGRIVDIEGVESNPKIMYAAAATGGLWKTVNAGITWEPVFDNEHVSNIGDIGLSQSNPDILYLGTGEANGRNSSSYGAGMFKSGDAGDTWEFIGLESTYHIARVLVHPADPDIVYAAAMGKLWADNEERGLFKTTDGGKTWNKILYIDEKTGVTDIIMDPVNSDILYAASYERIRDAFSGGDPVKRWGPGSGIWVSTNAGSNWEKISSGLPITEMGRIGLTASKSRPGMVYAIIETSVSPKMITAKMKESIRNRRIEQNKKTEEEYGGIAFGGIFRSADYGKTWTRMSTYNSRPFYYSQIRVDPNNHEVLWMGGMPLGYSNDGGKTVDNDKAGKTHVDYHAIWIDPNDSDHVVIGSDGGINTTFDGGKKWDVETQICLAQFYAITADMSKPYNVYGGLQDNGSWGGPSCTRSTWGIMNHDWIVLGFGDGFFCQADPEEPNTVYWESQYGNLSRIDLQTGRSTAIRPTGNNVVNHISKEKYRFDWNSPVLISPHNAKTLYYGGNRLFKSVDRGDNWKWISEDLTNDPENQFTAIVSVDESPVKPGVIWAGSNDGNVWLTRNGGVTWNKLNKNIPGYPEKYWVKRIEASNHVAGRAYLVFDGHRNDDREPYIYATENYGETWMRINNNLPSGSVYVVREDYHNPDLLFAGTENYVFASLDRGMTWSKFDMGMPNVPIHDLYIHPGESDLIVGTHGRGAWILDNITPLQQMTDENMTKDICLFNIRTETDYVGGFDFPFITDKTFRGDNPAEGSNIFYNLKDDPTGTVKIEILDVYGNALKTFEEEGKKGLNKVFWEFKFDKPLREKIKTKTGTRTRTTRFAPPGEYLVKLTYGDIVQTTTLKIEADPITK